MFEAWRAFVQSDPTPFTIPGHKRRAGALDPWLGRLLDADVPLYGGLDSVKLTGGVLGRAEALGASLWSADWCRYSTGGSTHANQAIALALGRPGDAVIVSRTAHRSTLLALVLAGLTPVWVPPEIDPSLGVPTGISLPGLEAALEEHPNAVGVLCVEPSYLGTVSDVSRIAALAHRFDVPVVVDQAWGAHFGLAPGYPPHALAAGADVMILSAHKTLPAFSQGSVLAARTERLDADRLERAFEASNTTSPAGAVLASIDASRALMQSRLGATLLADLAAAAARLRAGLAREAGLRTLGPERFVPGRFDPAKLVVLTAPSGHSGLILEEALLKRGIAVEMADRDTVVPLISLLDDASSLGRLEAGLVEAAAAGEAGEPRPTTVGRQWSHEAPQVLTPRQAFFANHETVTFAAAVGRVSAEVVAPYPPGVPILVPGELVTAETLEALTVTAASGARIAYAADPTLCSLQVLAGY